MAYAVTDGRGSDVLAVSATMITLSTIAVALRFWSRYYARKNGLWWDDWLSLAALPFVWALCGLSIYWVYIGLGQHVIHVHRSHAQLGLVLFVVDFIYNTGLTLVKLSVLMFYARVFKTVRTYRIAFWIVGGMLIAWCIAIDFVALFACSPIRKSWDTKVPGHCTNRQANFIGAAVPNILTDLILLILPMPMLWNLQTSTSRKLGLVGIFTAGYLVLVLSVTRCVIIAQEGDTFNKDLTWNGVTSEILLVCEVSIALISSCIPNIFNLVKHAAEKGFSRLSSKSSKSEKVSGGGKPNAGAVLESPQERRKGGFRPLQLPSKFSRLVDSSNDSLFGSVDRASSKATHDSDMV